MIEVLLGSKNAERVLLYIFTREEGYAREIAGFYNTDLKPIQMQLDKFEKGGVLVSRSIGRTRPYEFNPRYPFLNELKALLEKALSFYPVREQEEFQMNRPPSTGKGEDAMKKIKNMSRVELAAYVQDSLQAEGIQVVLSGGSVVSFYSRDKHASKTRI